jgi:hypothetical protein
MYYLVHQVPNSAGIGPVAVLSVGHVDDGDLLKVNVFKNIITNQQIG